MDESLCVFLNRIKVFFVAGFKQSAVHLRGNQRSVLRAHVIRGTHYISKVTPHLQDFHSQS